MNKQHKALIYNMGAFLVVFIIFRILVAKFTSFNSWQIPLAAAVISTILAPKFMYAKTHEGEKIFMKWLFLKGLKEIK